MEAALVALATLSIFFMVYQVWKHNRDQKQVFITPPTSQYPTPEEIRRGLRALERQANDGN